VVKIIDSEAKGGQKQISGEKAFDSKMAIAEQHYDTLINALIEKCDSAKKTKDWRLIKQLQGIINGWIDYFEAQKEYIQEAFDSKDPTKNGVLLFIDDQIKFLKVLQGELLR